MGGFDETAERLLLHHLSTPPEDAAFKGVVLIAGLARIGKSTLARRVANALHMRTLSTDELDSLYSNLPRKEAAVARGRLLSQICQSARGLVLEGKGLLHVSKHKTGSKRHSFAVDIDALRNRNTLIFMVGCCDSSADTWEEVLQAHGGWVIERGEEYLQSFSRTRPDLNRKLRDLAQAAGVTYLEIPREDFAQALERAAAAIIAEVRQGATPR